MDDLKQAKDKTQKTAIETAKSWGGESPFFASFAFFGASSDSDASHRVLTKLADRKSIAAICACDSCLRPACSTFPSNPYDLSTTAPVLDLS
jgi:hypothetical protein